MFYAFVLFKSFSYSLLRVRGSLKLCLAPETGAVVELMKIDKLLIQYIFFLLQICIRSKGYFIHEEEYSFVRNIPSFHALVEDHRINCKKQFKMS